MKNLLILLLLACTYSQVRGQQIPDYSLNDDLTKEQMVVRANEIALQTATYLLSIPANTNNTDRKEAAGYLTMWMSATSEYSFEIDYAVLQLYGENTALLPVMLAAMAEYEMKNPENKNDMQKVRLHAAQRLIRYAQDPANNVKMHDELQAAANADKKGKLDKYLASLNKED
jgi:hypothetical protein